jgi:acyl transferase domain-containing protein/NADPH:quinone reductase-like Zn-dependent oxidoreductase/acyl carrier protein
VSDLHADIPDAIAVVGMSGRFPDAPDVDALWRNLRAGRESISRFSEAELLESGVTPEVIRNPSYVPAAAVLADVEQFDAEFFRFTAREAQTTDPQHRLLLECAWVALESAGYVGEGFDGRVGVYAGAGASTYWTNNLARDAEIVSSVAGIQLLIGNAKDYVATRVSYKLNLTGPSLTVSTACSTSLVAVHLACQSLLDFHCDVALAGGVSIQFPTREGYLHQEGGIGSPDGHCRPFDAKAQGTVTGSGVGVVVLRRLKDAIKAGDTIHAIILGSAVNNDGADKVGFTAPSEMGQAMVIAEALSAANISPDTITYVEAHGTGTPLGDPIEAAALTRVFRRSTARRQFCALGSIKSNLGHLDEAAGVAGLIKAVLALRNRTLPPSLHFETANPKLDLENSPFFVNTAARDWASDGPRRAGVSSFGIGGTNAHVVLEEAPPQPATPSPRPASLLVVSARTRSTLDSLCRDLAEHLQRHPEISLADAGFTLAVGRRAFPERRAVVCDNHADAIARLRCGHWRSETANSRSRRGRAVFLFPGQGSQYAGMGAGLYATERAFRDPIDACAAILESRCGFDLKSALLCKAANGAEPPKILDETIDTRLALFSIEYAVAVLLRSWGIEPEAMIGDGLGEYVAATLAGVFSLDDVLPLVATRTRLMQSTHGAALDEFGQVVRKAGLRAPAVPFISNLTGDWITPAQATDPDYWVRHLRESVRFDDGIKRLLEAPDTLWIEAGPGRALAALVERHRDLPAGLHVLQTLPSARSEAQESAAILSTLGELWVCGAAVDWKNFFQFEQRRRIPLPTYPFERQRYWIGRPAQAPVPQPEPAPAGTNAAGSPIDSWFYTPRWTRCARAEDAQFAPGAWVLFAGQSDLVNAVAARLRETGVRVVVVRDADPYSRPASDEHLLPFDDAAAHARLWQELNDPLWAEAGIVYFAPLKPTRPELPPPETVRDAVRSDLSNLISLIQGLGSSTTARKLVVITNNTQSVTDDAVFCLEHAATWGATRVIASEYPNLACRTMDLDWRDLERRSRMEVAADILSALSRPDASLALRGGSLWVQHIEPARLPERESPPVRERGVYLITGGLGSMGLAFAEHLVQTTRARLILVSRTGLTPASPEPLERDAKICRRISRMESFGAEVCVIAADVSNPDDVARVVQTAEARFGAIHGVIHAAGVLGQTLVRQQTPGEVARVLAPKVDGTLNLASALGNRTLDFFILCSSMSSICPIPGQFGYAGANAFLDSFAQFRAARSPGLTVSINWGFWQELGMIEAAHVPEAVKQATRDEIRSNRWSQRGVEIFARVLRSEVPSQLLVTPHRPVPGMDASLDSNLPAHPVLCECMRESGQCSIFSGTITAGSAWFIDEHIVAGESVLPGTMYLDLAVAAFWHAHGRGAVEITDVCYLAPMVFGEREIKQVRLILQAGRAGCEFRILSQLSADRWREHARGEIRHLPLGERRQTIDLGVIEARLASDSHGGPRCPAGFRERVDSFPPHWHCVAHALFGTSEGFARFELPSHLIGDLPRFALHPALLDTATGFMAFRSEYDSFVPFSVRRVCVFDSLPARCASLFHLVPHSRRETPVFFGSVFDTAGREIVRLEDYTLRGVTPARPASDAGVPPVPSENVHLEIVSPGRLETLAYRPAPRLLPRAGEVEIEVRAAALNFIEVLYSLDMLPDLTDGLVGLGQECAGVVTRVADDVAAFKPGDEVIAYGSACFSLYATLGTAAVALKPPGLSFEQAAGLPAAFITAWHSLIHLGRLQPGERVLMHAAAGGVGLAAVRIAQWRGAEIFATAGSPEKRAFLREIGITHVMDSRSLLFADEVRRITKGEGVDVVLNSLGGDFIAASLELLRRHGRFLELGKRDIFRNTALGLGAFANYIAFFAVDIAPDMPGFTETWREVTGHLRSGSFGALPHRTFAATQAREAFEHMALARHIGKVVLSFADTEAVRSAASAQPDGLPWEEVSRSDTDALARNDHRQTPSPRAHPAAAEPAQHARPPLQTAFREPESVTEKTVAAVWEKLLGVSPIGADDDFFELKGDSLLAAQVMSRLHQALEVKLPLSLVFDFPTIRQLATQIEIRLRPAASNVNADSALYEEGSI